MKRTLYISLGIISFILPTIWGIYQHDGLLIFLTFLIYIVISLFWVFLFSLIVNGELSNPGDDIPFFFSIFTLGRKKIYYSDLGYFYMSIKRDGSEISIHKQGIFMSHKLFQLYYRDDLEGLRKLIKSHLDIIYRKN